MQEAPTSCESNPSLEELLEFERLLFELSVRFANVPADRVVAAIESALIQLVRFLGFDRSAFWEFIDEKQQHFLCTVAVEGVERLGAAQSPPTWLGSPRSFVRAAPSLFARTKISRPKQRPQRNIIAALAFAPFLSSLCPLTAASSQQSALGRSLHA